LNWKRTAIVTIGVLCLIGLGGTVYAFFKIGQAIVFEQRHSSLDHSLDEARTACNSKDPDVSIRGCTTILQSSHASEDQAYGHFQRGVAYERKNDLDHAIQDDSEVIRLMPHEYMAYVHRGYAYQRKGDLEHALADLNQAIQFDPEMSIAWANRSEVYRLKGDYARAIEDSSHVIKLEPKNFMAWNNRCYFRAIAGQLDDALADCNRSLAIHPDFPATLDSRGFTYLRMKKYDLAIRDYNDALRQDSKKAPSLYGRGLARRAQHDPAGSQADIAAAKSIDAKIEQTFKSYGVS
jgi:tetratricopeptide (TPR) repeat protein